MSTTDLAIVILAAGKGTRMKSDKPKVLHEIAGKPMLKILLDQLEQLNAARTIVVTAPDMDDVKAIAAPHRIAIQAAQNGTGDAVKVALPELEGFSGNVLILLGDEPFVPMNVLIEMAAHPYPTAMGLIPPDPTGLGRMIMNEEGTLDAIVEDKDCDEQQREIYVCNAGNYCVPSDKLKSWIEQIGSNNAQGEYYLTDMVEIAKNEGAPFDVFTIPVDHVWGINDRVQLAEHENVYQEMMRDQFLRAGVSMVDPDSVWFHHDTRLAVGVHIEPNVFFGPGVIVEEGVHIKAFCHFEGAHIRKNSVVGPFARLRPGSEIGEDVKIGNFVEVKKSNIGDGAKISHLAYVGDCEMGRDVNFSCGAITVNYDGFEKFKTVIGDGALVGSNVSLVAPVTIGKGAFLAAGSTITEDIPDDALGIGRSNGKAVEGWARNFRARKKKA